MVSIYLVLVSSYLDSAPSSGSPSTTAMSINWGELKGDHRDGAEGLRLVQWRRGGFKGTSRWSSNTYEEVTEETEPGSSLWCTAKRLQTWIETVDFIRYGRKKSQ